MIDAYELPLAKGGGSLFDELVAEGLDDDEFSSATQKQREYLTSLLADAKDELVESASDGSSTTADSLGQVRASHERVAFSARRRRSFLRVLLFLTYVSLILVAVAGALEGIVYRENQTAALVALGTGLLAIALLRSSVGTRLWQRIDDRLGLSLTVPLDLATRMSEARETEIRVTLQRVVRERLRLLFNKISGPSYDLRLPVTRATGLAETRDPLFVPTPASKTLFDLLRTMPNGTIGLAGPRGAGKTTLMRRVCETTDGFGTEEQSGAELKQLLGILVSAPVEFDARDFLLHLIAQLCWQVLGRRPSDPGPPFKSRYPSGGLMRRSYGLVLLIVSLLLVAVGVLLLDRSFPGVSSRQAWGLVAITAAFGLPAFFYLGNRPILRLEWNPPVNFSPAVRSRAQELLESIKFQQTYTSGWSGGLNLPIGAELSHEWGSSRAVNPLSFPEVAATLVEFLELLATERRVVICIDELDKMDSDQTARRFLNEIKVIFGLTGCFFLISVSEDAMGSFERRGMPFRDVFDSSLDEIVNVPNLDLESSGRLLAERVIGFPEQFMCLCHCLGSGLPRDVIRVAREVVELSDDEPTLAAVTSQLIMQELVNKRRAASVTLRKIQLEPELSACMDWFQTDINAGLSEKKMIERCKSFAKHLGLSLTRLDEGREKANEDRQEMLRIAIELVTFEYYAATVLQVFTDELDEEKYLEWTERDGPCLLERLTSGRQGFGINAGIAWQQISAARKGARLGGVAFPRLWAA